MSNVRVLVVDDSRQVREFVVQYVPEPNGFEVVEAVNGAEGMRKVLEGGIDLILLDLEMPKMTGFEVLDASRAQRSEIPVILMTFHGSEVIVVEMFRKDVRDYVIKPFTVDEILASIKREVRLQRQKATILFADIRGFTGFGARVTSEMLVNVLNHHIAVAAEAVLVERGTLDKFLGDAVMAYFNTPLPQPDHTLRAAWQICQAVRESHVQLPLAYQLQFGVGIAQVRYWSATLARQTDELYCHRRRGEHKPEATRKYP